MNATIGRTRLLIVLVALLMTVSFGATAILSFLVSRQEMRQSIIRDELPLTSDTIYSEIQQDLIRPVFISSMMSNDTFLRDWVLAGEKDVDRIARYLDEVKSKYGAFTAFFVSERTRRYYFPGGILKTVSESEPRDVWYFRVRDMKTDYEINVDPDLANQDALTIFINYRVYDFGGKFLGSAGVGLTVNAVRHLVERYERRYGRQVYFVNRQGDLVVTSQDMPTGGNISQIEGLSRLAPDILSGKGGAYEYKRMGETHLLNVRFIPELNWYVCVEKIESRALAGITRTLYGNLVVAFLVTILVVTILAMTIRAFQSRLEVMATTDKLTGLANRQALDILMAQAIRESRRTGQPLSLLMLDIDNFKNINDQYGHLVGDRVIIALSELVKGNLRASDIAGRWGGEEFLVLMIDCARDDALARAERLRTAIEEAEFGIDAQTLKTTVSVGVSQLQDGDEADSLLLKADNALYAAKRDGRNRIVASP